MDEPESATLSDREQRILAAMRAGALTIEEVRTTADLSWAAAQRGMRKLWQAGLLDHKSRARPAYRLKH